MRAIWTIVFLFLVSLIFAQATIKGSVEDAATGSALGFANIVIRTSDGKTLGTSADEQGNFSLNVFPGRYKIQVSYVGYKPADKVITVSEAEVVTLRFALEPAPPESPVVYVKRKRPFAIHQVKGDELQSANLGQDVPYLLKMTPSAVVSSDAGAGVGYTSLRVRGMDQTNINVTINGIPLNDPESHQVYWVDLPDLAASTEAIDIIRGVGASTNGAGAFGATVGVHTRAPASRPGLRLQASAGSFNTQKYAAALETGTVASAFAFSGRVSHISSDGYIDRATSQLNSYFLSGKYERGPHKVLFNTFSGHEITYQAWNGVPYQYANDPEKRTYNSAGTDKPGSPYKDEVDNYKQTHYQLIYEGNLPRWSWTTALHYTKGAGYYENYKAAQDVTDYGLNPFTIGDSLIEKTDLVRRKWLDNDFWGWTGEVRHTIGKTAFHLGGAANVYKGKHFGRVIWSQAGGFEPFHTYYDNDAVKHDANVFSKLITELGELTTYLDLQYRRIRYAFTGIANDGSPLPTTIHHNFFNPKAGLIWQRQNMLAYASWSVAHREPNRTDYKSAPPGDRPRPERLFDYEIGGSLTLHRWNAGLDLYYMQYHDQLVNTGKLNEVGEYVRVNIPDSYRMGAELTAQYQARHFAAGMTLSLSRNKIKQFTEYVDNWDTWTQETVLHRNPDLSFSPSVIGALRLGYSTLDKRFETVLNAKYVGKQYLDNTSNEAASLPAYSYADLSMSYVARRTRPAVRFSLRINNLTNALYSTNGWTYHFLSSTEPQGDPYAHKNPAGGYNLTGLYPQAGRNFLVGMSVEF